MIFIYRGYGWTIPLILPACALGLPGLWRLLNGVPSSTAFQMMGYRPEQPVALMIGGLIVALWGLRLNSGPLRPYLETETGRQYRGRPIHSMYFLPMQYWGFATTAAGAAWMAWKAGH